MAKVLVLGAGVIGVTTAYFLAEKGFEVTVVDTAEAAGSGASFANGAQLSYSKTYPLSNLSTIKKFPYLLFSKNTPIHIKSYFDYDFLRWCGMFFRQSFKAEENAAKVLDLALKSREILHELTEKHEINFDYNKNGKIYVFDNRKDFEHGIRYAESLAKSGIEQKILNVGQVLELEPGLSSMQSNIFGAIYSPIDESGDAKKFCDELTRICKDMGVKFYFNERIKKVKIEHGKLKYFSSAHQDYQADKYVIAMGAQSALIAAQMGITLPMYPMKGYSITVPATDKAPKINITDEGKRIVYSKIGDRLRIAGTAEFSGYNYVIDRKIVDGIINAAKTSFPDAGDYSKIEEWTGLRPMTASTVPIIGLSSKYNNLYFNTGHGMLGWTLACGSARKLTSLIS